MNIVYGCDDKYVFILATSLVSLLQSNQNVKELNIYLVSDNISLKNKQLLQNMVEEYNRKLTILPFFDFCEEIGIDVDFGHYSAAAYIRLFLARILVSLDKVLWIDCDTLVLKSLEPLWNIEMGDCVCAACADNSVVGKQKCQFTQSDKYYNSGVLLIDLNKWRKNNIENKCLQTLIQQKGYSFDVDQGILNRVLKGYIYTLPLKYNVSSKDYIYGISISDCINEFWDSNLEYYPVTERKEALTDPVIVHFLEDHSGMSRPWYKKCVHPKRGLWKSFIKMTPWINYEPIDRKISIGNRMRSFVAIRMPSVYMAIKKNERRKNSS